MTVHAVSGMVFKAVSDEASSERKAKSKVRKVRNEMAEQQAEAYSRWFAEHAPQHAAALGQMRAQKELEEMSAKLGQRPAMQAAFDVPRVEEDGKTKDPLPRPSPRG